MHLYNMEKYVVQYGIDMIFVLSIERNIRKIVLKFGSLKKKFSLISGFRLVINFHAGILNFVSFSGLVVYITLAFSFAIERRIVVTLCFTHP